MLHDALLVDDEEAAERDAVVGEDVVGGRDLLLEVGNQGVGEVAQTALLRREGLASSGPKLNRATVTTSPLPHQTFLHISLLMPCPCLTLRGVWIQARWENCESTDTPRISVFMSLNSLWRSLKAVISVGHTKVKSRG
jgi:hypothetical protein